MYDVIDSKPISGDIRDDLNEKSALSDAVGHHGGNDVGNSIVLGGLGENLAVGAYEGLYTLSLDVSGS